MASLNDAFVHRECHLQVVEVGVRATDMEVLFMALEYVNLANFYVDLPVCRSICRSREPNQSDEPNVEFPGPATDATNEYGSRACRLFAHIVAPF